MIINHLLTGMIPQVGSVGSFFHLPFGPLLDFLEWFFQWHFFLPIGWLYIYIYHHHRSHLLREPETAIEKVPQKPAVEGEIPFQTPGKEHASKRPLNFSVYDSEILSPSPLFLRYVPFGVCWNLGRVIRRLYIIVLYWGYFTPINGVELWVATSLVALWFRVRSGISGMGMGAVSLPVRADSLCKPLSEKWQGRLQFERSTPASLARFSNWQKGRKLQKVFQW